MTDNDKMRESFEKWYLMQPIAHKSHIVRISNGHYFGAHTETAWQAWQAAQAEQSAELERLRDITRTVAARLLHTLPMGAVCTCSRCELIQEARAAIAAEGEK